MKRKHTTLSIGFLLSFAGLTFWLVTPIDSPNVPALAPISGSGVFVELKDPAAQMESTMIPRKKKDGAATVGRARVFTCDWSDASEPEIAGSLHQKRDEITASLAQSKDPEHLLAAALFGFDTRSKEHFAAMKKALAADRDNPLTLWIFLRVCSLHPEETVCQDGEIEKRAILADGGNSALWGRIAAFRFRRGDQVGAFDALLNANAAPQFNGYFMEHVEMLARGYAAVTNNPYWERIVGGIGITVAIVSNVNGVYNGCREHASESAKWLQSCIEYGKRLERDGRTMLPILIGIAIQKAMYEISGDENKKMDADLRRRLITNIMTAGNRLDDEVLLRFDEKVMADYIAEWSAHGELRAMQFVKAEVVRLSQEPGYDPCKLKKARKSATND